MQALISKKMIFNLSLVNSKQLVCTHSYRLNKHTLKHYYVDTNQTSLLCYSILVTNLGHNISKTSTDKYVHIQCKSES